MLEQASAGDLPAFEAAVGWIEAALTGSVATAMCTVAVAAIGYLMLVGRLPARRGAAVVIGCMVLFSSRAIADGLVGSGPSSGGANRPAQVAPPVPAPEPPPSAVAPFDPYAGAAVPGAGSQARDLTTQ